MPRLTRAAVKLGFALLVPAAPAAAQAQTEAAAPGPALLEVAVNGQRGPEPMLFLRGESGVLYAPRSFFEHWRLILPPADPVPFDGTFFYPLDMAQNLRFTVSEPDQSVAIEAAPEAFIAQQASLSGTETLPMTPPATGAFLNYDLLAESVRGETALSGFFEAGLFTPHGVLESGFIATHGTADDRLVRLETHWSVDRPDSAISFRIGDSLTFGGLGASPVRFAGLHVFRNYAVQPGFITLPLPGGSGSAAVPSVVDVYVNNILQSSRQVQPGPFELTNIPVHSGGGSVRIVVRDLLGREVVTEQPYYASSRMLRRGLHDFSYEAGFLREEFGLASNRYGAFMASTTHRYGLSDRVTVEASAQASRAVRMAGAGATWLAFDLGLLSGSASVSHSERGTGYRLSAAFERSLPGLSIGARSEYTSPDFLTAGAPDGFRPPRHVHQAFASLPVRGGAVSASLLHRSLRDGPAETVASLSGSFRIGQGASASLFARRVVAGESETAVGANLAFSFGPRRTLSAGIEHGGRGVEGYASLQKDIPPGIGAGYRVSANFGEIRRVEAAYVRNFSGATVTAQASRSGGATGLRLSAAGSVGILGGGLFAARNLGESFAAVRVGAYPGLRVYADDQLIGLTGRDGSLILPRLRPFQRNRIRIDDSDLPVDARIETPEIVLRPYARSGTSIRFTVRRERGVLMQVRLEDGRALPAGAEVRIEGEGAVHTVVPGGEVYVPDLSGAHMARAEWDGGRCAFSFTVPETADPQPRLEGLICREMNDDSR